MTFPEIGKTPEIINPSAVAIVAPTSYPTWRTGEEVSSSIDKVRGDLALQCIDAASTIGYRILVSDSGSSLEFREELKKRGITMLERQGNTRGAGRRQLIESAGRINDVSVIVKTEPEKVSLIADCIPQLVAPIIRGDADIVVPKRREDLFRSTYPQYMYESEIFANKKYNQILRKFGLLNKEDPDLDIYFGPIVFRNTLEVRNLFLEEYEMIRPVQVGVGKYVRPDDYSNAQFFPVVKALSIDLPVDSVEVPFSYPQKQKENELTREDVFKEKRKSQKWGILDELVLFIRYLKNQDDGKNRLEKVSPISS